MKRNEAREEVMKALYEIEISGNAPEFTLANLKEQVDDDASFAYIRSMITGILDRTETLNERIGRYSKEWGEWDRLAIIDRIILRLSTYEILYREDIPNVVSVNEAVNMAKKYSTEASGSFVNGILARILKETQNQEEA